jgi:hypothetical protein
MRQEIRLQCRSDDSEWPHVNLALGVYNTVFFFGGEATASSFRLGWMTGASLVWLGDAEACLQTIASSL